MNTNCLLHEDVSEVNGAERQRLLKAFSQVLVASYLMLMWKMLLCPTLQIGWEEGSSLPKSLISSLICSTLQSRVLLDQRQTSHRMDVLKELTRGFLMKQDLSGVGKWDFIKMRACFM